MLLKLTSLQASIKPEAVETIDEPVWELEEKNVEDGAEVQRKLKTKMAKRLVKKTKKLHDFLEEHGFSEDVNEPQKPSCFCRRECLYPIHVATKNGDAEVVRLLIDAGANPSQKTSKGRSTVGIAQKAHHHHLVPILEGAKPLSARELMKIQIESC
ncbi:unnamed protein product [Durusdinium trenchii]|uniref:Uncharacterized protein n=2 Tax=Durusdinium trenchii TaxID=1381693 RepID=A0ABP0S5F0_9DINO